MVPQLGEPGTSRSPAFSGLPRDADARSALPQLQGSPGASTRMIRPLPSGPSITSGSPSRRGRPAPGSRARPSGNRAAACSPSPSIAAADFSSAGACRGGHGVLRRRARRRFVSAGRKPAAGPWATASQRVPCRRKRLRRESEKMIWSMLMWPHPPELRSTISITASLPCKSATSQLAGSRASRSLPVAVRTTLPSTRQIDARLARMAPAADEETDVAPLDAERLRGGRALRAVAVEERVDQAVADKTAHRLLAGLGAVGRTFAEGVAGDRPAFVGPSSRNRRRPSPTAPKSRVLGAQGRDRPQKTGPDAVDQHDAALRRRSRARGSAVSAVKPAAPPSQTSSAPGSLLAAGRRTLIGPGCDRIGRLSMATRPPGPLRGARGCGCRRSRRTARLGYRRPRGCRPRSAARPRRRPRPARCPGCVP